jgi:hypothetical protein
MQADWLDNLRERLAMPFAVALGVIVFTFMAWAIMAPDGYDARNYLRKAYPDNAALFATFKSSYQESCGFYRLKGQSYRWKYLNTPKAFWAQGVASQWRFPLLKPAAFAQFDGRWQTCMDHQSLGQIIEDIFSPAFVALLNAT